MEENKNAYSEVIEILKLIDDEEKLEKLPMEMLELLKSKTNPEYKPQISMEIPLEEQNLQPETFSILSWIATKYWNEESSIEETDLSEPINTEQNEEAGNNEEIIENKNDVTENSAIEDLGKVEEVNNTLPILHKDLKWYERIKIKIIEILDKLFKKRKIREERGNA